jgi:hypothetical protein
MEQLKDDLIKARDGNDEEFVLRVLQRVNLMLDLGMDISDLFILVLQV